MASMPAVFDASNVTTAQPMSTLTMTTAAPLAAVPIAPMTVANAGASLARSCANERVMALRKSCTPRANSAMVIAPSNMRLHRCCIMAVPSDSSCAPSPWTLPSRPRVSAAWTALIAMST